MSVGFAPFVTARNSSPQQHRPINLHEIVVHINISFRANVQVAFAVNELVHSLVVTASRLVAGSDSRAQALGVDGIVSDTQVHRAGGTSEGADQRVSDHKAESSGNKRQLGNDAHLARETVEGTH